VTVDGFHQAVMIATNITQALQYSMLALQSGICRCNLILFCGHLYLHNRRIGVQSETSLNCGDLRITSVVTEAALKLLQHFWRP
jgi:hypothetical protein